MTCPKSSVGTGTEAQTVRYVALLAFNKIVVSHAHLVSLHQDVIMSCIDDPDISIRLQALELGAGMVDSESLITVVERLIRQLRTVSLTPDPVSNARTRLVEIEPAADSEGDDPEEQLQSQKLDTGDFPALPSEYRIIIISQILEMCSKNTYNNIADFEWYLGILVQLGGLATTLGHPCRLPQDDNQFSSHDAPQQTLQDITLAIGRELRNVAVRVNSVRTQAVGAAAALADIHGGCVSFSLHGHGGYGVLGHAVWILGEFANNLPDVHETLNCLIHPLVASFPETIVSSYLQALPKVLISTILRGGFSWSLERQSMMALLLARILHFLEPLTTHPSLDVQERSVELVELIRITAQAVNNHDEKSASGPLLLTTVLPALFTGSNLNPVAPNAQKKVPFPRDLDLDTQLNQNLQTLLRLSDLPSEMEYVEFEDFYNHRKTQKSSAVSALEMLPITTPTLSYQQAEDSSADLDGLDKKRKERRNRNRDDPFYIMSDDFSSGNSTPFHDFLKSSNGGNVDVDSIPIMNLDLGEKSQGDNIFGDESSKPKSKPPQTYIIADDENVNGDDSMRGDQDAATSIYKSPPTRTREKSKKSLLQVDSSGLGSYLIDGRDLNMGPRDSDHQEADDEEMTRALKEVEQLRLKMQRASERTNASDGIPPEGTLIRKKKKKKTGKVRTKDASASIAPSLDANEAESDRLNNVSDLARKFKRKKKRKPKGLLNSA